ncbi:MAG: DUF4838 domain-containing protein [Victivallales bacterium]|nr:DUF4838 domain-containing protein [Victivallales bacterium]
MKIVIKVFLGFLAVWWLTMELSAFQIVSPPSATSAEKTAATELSFYFSQLSSVGETTPVVAKRDSALGPAIYVGQSSEALAVLGLGDWSELKPDEVCYCVDAAGDVWIAGDRPRGTLYAVYEFLEREYGVRFFTEDDTLLPKRPRLELPPSGTTWRYAPPIQMRTVAYQNVTLRGSNRFKAQMRNNFFGRALPQEWGGTETMIGFVHTMDKLLPQDKYFAAHPEWYALRDGLRQGGALNQLCLTNHEMRQELIRRVKEELVAHPQSRLISVSQNDNKAPCECATCQEFIATHGNQTDLLLDCVNEIAAAVAKEFPEVLVETLAYHYTRQPPKTVRPLDNVIIRYCTIEEASFAPIDSERNRVFFNELAEWGQIAKQMMIWHYLTDFSHYYMPHPNWTCIAPDTRLFRDCHAISVFQQGSHDQAGDAADLADLRAYLVSKLLWNPDLDDQELIREFVTHHYGPGAPAIFTYLNGVITSAAAHPECKDGCNAPNTDGWLSDDELARLWRVLYDAARRYQADPVYGPRLATAAIPLTINLFERDRLLASSPPDRLVYLRDVDANEVLDFLEAALKTANCPYLAEAARMPVADWLAKHRATHGGAVMVTRATEGGRPPQIAGNREWWGWNVENLYRDKYCFGPKRMELLPDAAASDGQAIMMPNTHREWFVQCWHIPPGRFEVYLTARCDLKPGAQPKGGAMSFGNYPAGPKREVPVAELTGSEYKLIPLGISELNKAQYLYAAPVINDQVERIWIDRLILVRPDDALGRAMKILQ